MFVPSCRVCTASWQLAGRKTWDMWLVELDKGAGSDLKRASERVLEPTDRWCVCVCIRARGNPASRSDLPLVLCCASLRFVLPLLLPTSTSRAEHHTPLATACPQEDATAINQLFQRSPICLESHLARCHRRARLLPPSHRSCP
jgi:hypothetical protein